MLQLSWPLFLAICFLIAASSVLSTIVIDYKWEDWSDELRETERPAKFWIFNALCFMLNAFLTPINGQFLWYAFWDANRRISLMRQASYALELDFHSKDEVSVRMPTINFLDRESLLSWLEARKLILETGSRF